jgi:hypothetical protein
MPNWRYLTELAWCEMSRISREWAFRGEAHSVSWQVAFLAPAAASALLAAMPSNGLAGDPSANRNVDCVASAFQGYTAALLKLQGIEVMPGGNPKVDENHLQIPFSIERTIAGRRLEEGYCLTVVACERRAGGTDLEDAANFIQCIDDEDEEHVLSNLESGDEDRLKEAIKRLQDEEH